MSHPELAEGAALFDAGRFWDAHEAWERAWIRLPRGSAEHRFYQGLILLAAAFLHRDRARTAPERSTRPALRCYRSAMQKLEGLPDEMLGVDLVELRRAAAGCFDPLEEGGDASVWPPAPALRL